MRLYVDVTPLYDLGQVGGLDVLKAPERELVVPQTVVDEVTVEPAATNLDLFLEEADVVTDLETDGWLDAAAELLDAAEYHSDVELVAGLLQEREHDRDAVLISDDRRLRAMGDGLGATVTGTFGVVVRASLGDKYFSTTQTKRLLRRTDQHGLQMTGQLRERAIGEMG